ncbi:phosphomannose isomerase type I [Dictyocaulus viviparus]|uniref:Mannose-6-phosphate isomerase n=1 Tax=Dictyocaulus viviparus TaxID=29172 RepID=A0A0D8XK64_DICVI|nr:phosphomannose isomerase type I [Dictyocaulus viviparus]
MFKLICTVQQYDWGKPGSQSIVAALLREGHHCDYVDDNKPYAEFWMGVHPNGPSKLAESSEDLSTLIKNHPNYLGDHEHGTLQFLFKVLSVNKALSIQCHPTKEEAILLNTRNPLHYPDQNHKPEMAIALSHFELLCGFRPAKEIHENLRSDVGVFAPLILNYFTLKPGEATFLGPNEPHAYLLGDCIECMACSDNTIRAGLTPKFKDIQTLCASLRYFMREPPVFSCTDILPGVMLYSPPVQEFAVQAVKATATHFSKVSASCIVIVITGNAIFKTVEISLNVHRW